MADQSSTSIQEKMADCCPHDYRYDSGSDEQILY